MHLIVTQPFQMSTDTSCTYLTDVHARTLLNNHETFLFDCDGVLWNYPDIFPGAIELLNYLTEQVGTLSIHLVTHSIMFRANVSFLLQITLPNVKMIMYNVSKVLAIMRKV
jgi:hypothetical protein